MPDAETRYVRLKLDASSRGQGYGIQESRSGRSSSRASPNEFFRCDRGGVAARHLSRARFRRAGVLDARRQRRRRRGGAPLRGRRAGDPKGRLLGRAVPLQDGALGTWSAVRARSRSKGLPADPVVGWKREGISLEVTAFARAARRRVHALRPVYAGEQGRRAPAREALSRAPPFSGRPAFAVPEHAGGVRRSRASAWKAGRSPSMAKDDRASRGGPAFGGRRLRRRRPGRAPAPRRSAGPHRGDRPDGLRLGGVLLYDLDLAGGEGERSRLRIPFRPGAAFAGVDSGGVARRADEVAGLEEARNREIPRAGGGRGDGATPSEATSRTSSSTATGRHPARARATTSVPGSATAR